MMNRVTVPVGIEADLRVNQRDPPLLVGKGPDAAVSGGVERAGLAIEAQQNGVKAGGRRSMKNSCGSVVRSGYYRKMFAAN